MSEPPITWGLTWPNEPPQPDFTAYDGDKIIGRVYQYPHGPQQGLWLWTMTVVLPGPRLPGQAVVIRDELSAFADIEIEAGASLLHEPDRKTRPAPHELP